MRSRERTTRSRVLPSAKVLVKSRLHWLGGFPVSLGREALQWQDLPRELPVSTRFIRRRDLQVATRALKKLDGELSEALPLLFPEPDRWRLGCDVLLDHLKAAVHDATAPPRRLPGIFDDMGDATKAGNSGTAALLDALSWSL